jgi:hypothetical protein
MFQTTAIHNDWNEETVEEFIEFAGEHGLTVISQEFNETYQETTLVLQGTKEGFFSWNDALMEGGPSWDEEEFMESLIEIQAA